MAGDKDRRPAAEEHLAVAEEAERCAAHERREQIRWRV